MINFERELRKTKKFDSKYYKELIDVINSHPTSKPDISIETCKAIIEGLSKLILEEIQQKPSSYFNKGLNSESNSDSKSENGDNLSKLFKDARSALKKKVQEPRIQAVYEDKLIEECNAPINYLEQLMNAEIIARIGKLRNDHGDISHGKSPYKVQINDEDLAQFIIGLTDSIATYMLRKFNQITREKVYYEDNSEFNSELDNLYPLDGKVLYSKALFEQDPEAYEVELENFKATKEEEAQNNEKEEI